LRSPKGQTVLNNIDSSQTVAAFRAVVAENSGVQSDYQILAYGYPAKDFPTDESQVLSAFLKSGETINVEQSSMALRGSDVGTILKKEDTTPKPPRCNPKGACIVRPMGPDGGCLFHSVSYCLEKNNPNKVNQLREFIARKIQLDEMTYNEGILGKKPSEYAKWIVQPKSWGGSVELSIFSDEYKCEIVAWDTARKRPNVFGEGKGYRQRCYLIYNGIHYDTMVWNVNPDNPTQDWDVVLFDPDDDMMAEHCRQLVNISNQAGNFVDEYEAKLRCCVCGVVVIGNKQATEHGNKTGHASFDTFR